MKIGPLETANTAAAAASAATGAVDRAERRAPGAAPAGPATQPSAKVDLSASAAAIGGGADGSFDQAKVDRIAQAIRDGSFEVNAEAIADKLIANAQELLGKSGV
jgi:negative regulator of flagellin synthesis FlgM